MIIPNFKNTLAKYNIRGYEEHAYRTTLYIAKHRMLIMEMRSMTYVLEVVDNSQNSWHTIEEFEHPTEEAMVNAVHEYLDKHCDLIKQKNTKQLKYEGLMLEKFRLSKKAKKLYSTIESLKSKTLKLVDLQVLSKQSQRAVWESLRELKDKGYLARNSMRGRITTHRLLQKLPKETE